MPNIVNEELSKLTGFGFVINPLFAYCYIINIKTAIPAHVVYWQVKAPQAFSDGPFMDWTGGLIIFPADGRDMSESII